MRIGYSKGDTLFRTVGGWEPLLGDLSERRVYMGSKGFWDGAAYLGKYWTRL